MLFNHEKIIRLLTLSKTTQTELSALLGTTQSYISKAYRKGFKQQEQEKIIRYVKDNHLNKKKEIEKILNEVDHD